MSHLRSSYKAYCPTDVILLDTPQMWSYFASSQSELLGRNPNNALA